MFLNAPGNPIMDDRNHFLYKVRSNLDEKTVLLLMGARDPSLEEFGKEIFAEL